MKKLLLAAIVLFAFAAPSFAQLPPIIEGLQMPALIGGASYLSTDPGPGFKRVNLFLTANVPGIKIGTAPLYVGGIGVTGGELSPSLTDIQFGTSIPLLTWAPKDGQFVVQGGYTKVLTGSEKPDGWYLGFGFTLQSPATLKAKRLARDQAKAKGGK